MNGQDYGAKKDESGMTQPRMWPTNADQARMECISKARRAVRLLDDALDVTTSPEVLRAIGRVIRELSEIEVKLIEVRNVKGENDHE